MNPSVRPDCAHVDPIAVPAPLVVPYFRCLNCRTSPQGRSTSQKLRYYGTAQQKVPRDQRNTAQKALITLDARSWKPKCWLIATVRRSA